MSAPRCKLCGYALKWVDDTHDGGDKFWAAYRLKRRVGWEELEYGQSFGFCNVFAFLDHEPQTELERYVNEDSHSQTEPDQTV